MKYSISKKLWLSFSISIVLIILINAIGSFALSSVSNKYEKILDRDVQRIVYAKDLEIAQKDLAKGVLEYVTINKATARQEIEQEIENGSTAARGLIELSQDEKSLVLLEDLKVKTVMLFESNNKIFSLIYVGDFLITKLLLSRMCSASLIIISLLLLHLTLYKRAYMCLQYFSLST